MSLRDKIKQKKYNASKEGLEFLLTEQEVQNLLDEAGISWERWTSNDHVLARFNDKGNYELGTCRFITWIENQNERKTSESLIRAGRKNLTLGRLPKTHTKESRHLAALRAADTKRNNGVSQSKKCEPNCTCKRHNNGGWNKGIPWSEDIKKKIREGVLRTLPL